MPQYKLFYFDGRGAAEPIRLILTHAGQSFEDVRIPMGGLTPEKKEELQLPWGQVPVLEIDGVKKMQSFAIVRLLAKQYNLAGKNDLEANQCDEITEAARDLMMKTTPIMHAKFAKDEEKFETAKKNFLDNEAPGMLKKFNTYLENHGKTYFVGSSLTYSDIVFVHIFSQSNTLLNVTLEKDYPAIEKLLNAVHTDSKLKPWFDKRPKTMF